MLSRMAADRKPVVLIGSAIAAAAAAYLVYSKCG